MKVKRIRGHGKIGSALRTISMFMAVVMLFTAIPVINAIDTTEETPDQSASVSKSVPQDDSLKEQTFELTPEDGVTVTLTGLMPVDGYAEAKKANVNEEDVLHAYDITIYYRYGKEFEPAEDAPISVSFRSSEIADAIIDDDISLEAEHIADNGKKESVDLNSAKDGKAEFEAESFSIYVIKAHDNNTDYVETPRIIYHFLSPSYELIEEDNDVYYKAGAYSFPNKHNDMVTTQILKNGESLQEVVLPENNKAGLFYGWYVVNFRSEANGVYSYDWGTGNESPVRQEFNKPVTVPSSSDYAHKDQHIYLAPLFGHYRFLTFHQAAENDPNANIIIARKLVVLNNSHDAELRISDVRAPSSNPNKIVFWGWKFTHTGLNDSYEDNNGGKTEILRTINDDDSEIVTNITIHDEYEITGVQPSSAELLKMNFDIWPEFREARWFYFDTGGNGADYVPARFVMVDEPTDHLHPLTAKIPTRPGYNFIGWYCKVQTSDGNTTEVRLTDRRNIFWSGIYDSNRDYITEYSTDPNVLPLNTGVKVQVYDNPNTAVQDEINMLVMDTTADEQYFYAKWTPVYQTNYQVIIWKQKITDDVQDNIDGNDANKTYDFGNHYEIEDVQPNADDADKTAQYLAGDYENKVNTDPDNYKGFVYRRTEIVNGTGNNNKKINSDGSTVVNVYYDRVKMDISYYYRSNDLDGEKQVVGNDVYIETSDDAGVQYGVTTQNIDQAGYSKTFFQLTRSAPQNTATFVFPYKYSASTSTTATSMFALENNEYIELEREDLYKWSVSGYVYTPTAIATSNTSSATRNQYVLYNGGFYSLYSLRNTLYFNTSDKKWYRERTSENGKYYYSVPVTEAFTRSSASTQNYTGERYVINGYEITETTSNAGTQYGKINNKYYTLSRSTTGYQYYNNNEVYSGTRYTRTSDNTVYTGNVYKKDDQGNFVQLTGNDLTEYDGAMYGKRANSTVYEELSRNVETTYTWTNASTGESYVGIHYLKLSKSNVSGYAYIDKWTGLFGQNFLRYNYSFPDQFQWKEEGGTGQTLLESFSNVDANNKPITDYKIYSQGDAQRGVLYHVRQKLNGTYSITEASCYDIAHVSYSDNLTFNFSNKFDGFEVCAYSFDFSTTAAGATETAPTRQVKYSSKSNTLYVYHRRKEATLTFNENYIDFGETATFDLEHIQYQQPLKAYKNAYVPGTRKHYTFTGWYEDITCTQLFDFEKEVMPNANKVLYAGWTTERYLVTVDADGGEMDPGGTFSTYFRINYNEIIDEYAGIRKNYIEDADQGTYVYLDFSYEKIMALDPSHYGTKMVDENGKLDFPGALRKSFYIIGTSQNIEDYFNSVCATVGDEEYKYSDYFDNVDTFKSFIKKNPANPGAFMYYTKQPGEYALYGWFKVIDDNGNTEPTPYNFMNHVEEDVHLKAKWVQVGKYSFAYNPTMSGTGITGDMARYNDPLESDKFYVDGASAVVLQAPTNLRVDAQAHQDDPESPYEHEVDPDQYVFRGWRIVGENGQPLEDNVFYDPGDPIEVNYSYAIGNVIHMEAYYEKKESTIRRVDYTSLTLHANADNATGTGRVNAEGLDAQKHESADLTNKTVVLDRQLNNGAVHLKDYYDNFTNTNGYKLIGWNSGTTQNSSIPEYCSDAVIGINQDAPIPNDLYAVWEPMVYLTLDNRTSQSVTFNLKFTEGNTSNLYNGETNIVDDHLRTAFVDGKSGVVTAAKVNNSNGEYSVTLESGKEVKLVIPQGLDYTYTVSGSYATQNGEANASNLFIYNSGDANSVSIAYNSSGSNWKMNYGQTQTTHSAGSSINYSTAGTLVSGTQGQMVMFSESDPTTQLHIRTAYYDTDTGEWTESTSETGPCATPGFILSGVSTNDPTVNLINNNQSVKFGLEVTDTNPDYKFIGWYTTLGASPNTPTVDGDVTGFGAKRIDGANGTKLLSVPLKETTYYALYVPYANKDLTINHSQKADSAGNCASENGLTLSVTYGGATNTGAGNATDPASLSVSLNEQALAGNETITIKVGAKAAEHGTYNATYHGDEMVVGTMNDSTGYYEHSYSYSVSELMTVSDTVKGLVTMNNVYFYSEFSLGYEITYRYTARDSRKHDYVIKGVLNNYDETEFKDFVVSKTPYIRTLAGDTVWDVDNMKVTKQDGGFTALLEEIPDVRGYCRVTIIDSEGYTRYDTVPYGQTFTKEQAVKWTAPERKGDLYFNYWAITNNGARISECYDTEFHYAFWNNYTIEPIYSENPASDPTSANWQFVTIDYIDTSRNQWGTETLSTESEADRSMVTDKVVADMDISFNDGTNLICESFNEQGVNAYKLGVIFEQIGTTASNGTFDENMNTYTASEDETAVKNRVRDILTKSKDSNTGSDYYYNETLSGYYYTRINISTNTVSNFNRSEFARSFSTANVKDKVFRVYAYMILPGNGDSTADDDEIILSDPYYMTMFKYSNKNYVLNN